jgi:prevent-host-death family protein
MREIALSAVKNKLSEIVDEVRRGQDVVISKHEKPVAVLVEMERYQRLQEIEDRFAKIELTRALRGKKYRLEEVLNELDITK